MDPQQVCFNIFAENGFQVAAMAAAAVPERHGRSLAGSQAGHGC